MARKRLREEEATTSRKRQRVPDYDDDDDDDPCMGGELDLMDLDDGGDARVDGGAVVDTPLQLPGETEEEQMLRRARALVGEAEASSFASRTREARAANIVVRADRQLAASEATKQSHGGLDGVDGWASDDEDAKRGQGHQAMETVRAHGEGDEIVIDQDTGTRLEPFNMQEELQEGYIDAAGNYVRREDEGERDDWLAEVEEQGWTQPVTAAAQGPGGEPATDDDDDDAPMDPVARVSHLASLRQQLVALLASDRETPAHALRRTKEEGDTEGLDRISELTNLMVIAGDPNIYAKTRAALQRELASQPSPAEVAARMSKAREQAAAKHATCHWEYKWLTGESAGTVHGPYSSADMHAWREWFTGDSKVSVRMVSGPGATRNPAWVPYSVINFSKMP